MRQYYGIDLTRASLAELWRQAPTVLIFLLYLLLWLCRIRVVPTYGIALGGLRFIELHAIADDAVIKLKSVTDVCAPLGFRPCFWSTVDTIGPIAGYSAFMLES